MKKIPYFFLGMLMWPLQSLAQIVQPVHWTYAIREQNSKEIIVLIKAVIDKGWHIYSQSIPDGGPVKTSFIFVPSKDYTLVGNTTEPQSIKKLEEAFKMYLGYFEQSVVFQQKIKLYKRPTTVKVKLSYMACTSKQCLPPSEINFSIPIKAISE